MCLGIGGHHEIVKRERAQHSANLAVSFQGFRDDGIVAGTDGELVNRPVGVNDSPASVAQQATDLREQKHAVEGLVRSWRGPAISRARVQVVEAHEIEIVRRRQEKCAAGAGNAGHFPKRRAGIRQMFDRFAGDDRVKGVLRVRQVLSIGLRQFDRRVQLGSRAIRFSASDLQRGAGKVGTKHARATRSEKPGKAATTACKYSVTSLYQGLSSSGFSGAPSNTRWCQSLYSAAKLMCPPANYRPRERDPPRGASAFERDDTGRSA